MYVCAAPKYVTLSTDVPAPLAYVLVPTPTRWKVPFCPKDALPTTMNDPFDAGVVIGVMPLLVNVPRTFTLLPNTRFPLGLAIVTLAKHELEHAASYVALGFANVTVCVPLPLKMTWCAAVGVNAVALVV